MNIVNFVGRSGSGKTTLIESLIRIFTSRGLRVAAVKNAHHGFDLDKPGKDSYKFRSAGASQVILRTEERWAMLSEAQNGSPSLSELIRHLDRADLVIVEGFKSEEIDALRLEVWRKGLGGEAPLMQTDTRIRAVVTDVPEQSFGVLTTLDIDEPGTVADWIEKQLNVKVIDAMQQTKQEEKAC